MHEQLKSLIFKIAKEEVLSRFLCVGISRKKDGSLLTDADIASQYAFSLELPKLIDAPVLGEEMSEEEQQTLWQQNAQTGLWVIDPIDGTTNFVNGFPHFALSVAFIQNGLPKMGAIYNPINQEFFWAQKDQGAFLNGRPLPIFKHNKNLDEAVLMLATRNLQSRRLIDQLYSARPYSSLRSMGCSTLDWCYLAAGRCDIYLHGGQKLWDYAAGSLILAEAGGMLSTLENDDFWADSSPWQRSVVAARQPGLFETWKRWIEQNQ